MERLTDQKTADTLAANYKALRDAGQPRDIGTERYLKLALYECKEEKGTLESQIAIFTEFMQNKFIEEYASKTNVFLAGRFLETR
jgi:hypothetical protein